TPIVVFSALALAIIPTLLTGNYQVWIYRALVFLVISCPCALVISVPLSYFSGIGALAKKGVLVKGGNYLQALAEVDMIAFDKTGTLTDGNFTVQQVIVISPAYNEQEILQYCGALENESSHPIARTISQFANSSLKASKVQEIAGKGIKGMVGGKAVVCGNDAMLTQLGLPVTSTNHQGTTVVEVVIDNVHVASILIGDKVKKGARETLALLKKLGIKKTVMLTGDTTQSAEAIAQELGIDQVRAQLLPQDKVLAFESLKGADAKVAYVGDGINDAPVLGLADVGISMGAMGSDAAIEASDIVVMTDDINHVGQAYYYARKTSRTVKQNITVALTIKLATLILGAFGLASMWLAIFADVGVAMLAILNSLRLMIPRNK
ncbi:MAG: heavy metal translocating P-type ATPase, partial [Sphaerochaetaceae bacterium]